MPEFNFQYNKISGNYEPTQYPIREKYDMRVPEEISKDFNQLTSLIEDKYSKEFLKVCAFYNKLFISLKAYDWSRSSYNTVPFTLQHQERTDTGTGLSSNYLKAAIDLVVSRIGNTTFEYKLKAEQPTIQYTIFKDEVEREFKALIRKHKLLRLGLESFHDCAILSFAHAFIDPWAGRIRKVSDWELGCYESEFVAGRLQKVIIRDFAFPVSELGPYEQGFDAEFLGDLKKYHTHCDLRLYIDCVQKKKYAAINSKMSEGTEYPFEKVLIATLSWDVGLRKTTVASLFDTLYPLQRQLDKLLAKKSQILAMYKGPVPVFTGISDMDYIVKNLSNSAGEILFLDTQRRATDFLTVLEPTPLDPNMNAEMEAIRAQMFELAGVQQISLDPENYRSAAAMIAIKQMRDAGFQSQLTALAQYLQDIVDIFVTYQAQAEPEDIGNLSWKDVQYLLEDAYIDIVPVQDLDPTAKVDEEPVVDHMLRHVEQFIIGVCKGIVNYDNLDYSYDRMLLKQQAATRYVELRALGKADDTFLQNLQALLVELFIDDLQAGVVQLPLEAMEPVSQEQAPLPQEIEPQPELGFEGSGR